MYGHGALQPRGAQPAKFGRTGMDRRGGKTGAVRAQEHFGRQLRDLVQNRNDLAVASMDQERRLRYWLCNLGRVVAAVAEVSRRSDTRTQVAKFREGGTRWAGARDLVSMGARAGLERHQ